MNQGLILAFLVAIGVEILLPLVLALWLNRRLGVPWRLFGYGALVFLVFQLLTRLPGIQIVQYFLQDTLQGNRTYELAWIGVAALTAGLFEEGGRYLGYRFFWKGEKKSWRQALMYGAGHGGLESMLLVGGLSILSLIQIVALSQMDLSSLSLSPEQLETMRQAQASVAEMAWWMPLLGAAERVMTMAIQISLSVLVLQVFVRESGLWWWLALAYHTVVDLVSVLMVRYLTPLQVEGVVLLFALFSLWIIFRLRPREDAAPASPG